ncbi:DUF5518 domain-containing protein [Haloparvum sedimenti]|uniref:DUF5518 domain-containing protein n=1 Tax=Haloparvum sedimenti TaxID=1678448 RepID=UPI00071E8505|nr:DUF5518 domain-containing protein [Haloparvum sedimenti]
MDTDGNTLLNAALGAATAVVLSWIPFSPVLGGALAGYLQGGEPTDGAKVGALAGGIASLPMLFVLGLILFIVPFVPEPGIAAVGVLFLLFAVAISLVYGAAFGALGGVLGIYVRDEF